MDSFLAWAGIPPGRLNEVIALFIILAAEAAGIYGWFPSQLPMYTRRKWRATFFVLLLAGIICFRYF